MWNNIDYILNNVVRRAIATHFDLAQGSHQATCTKKKTFQYSAKIILVFQSRMHSKTAQQNTVKVPAAQFRIAYTVQVKMFRTPTSLPEKPHHRRHVRTR